MLFAADYPFLNVFWTMILFFFWVAWIWVLITVFIDLFRRHDASGWVKALWIVFLIFLPFLGVLVYVIANGHGMTERRVKDVQADQAQFDEYVQSVAAKGGAASEIEKAKGLLDSGAITQAEYDSLKAKALA
ncbi:SHOCT domain-containing protein [Solirubrobacter ginsenosidimutans]|uniref:SHOCT domain-containing protein n=1 Tax=Solirubrobacter ginsenosidimutans TaxID=490573 RepID=A0A9X3MWQ8_9ACTN|nr:SHOCT domain-containing protein [Solirubrobacter ginsenosidimutans]MDA0164110.1 SHOCT domain-containing protein [Solirubrobacter ginsenosidimutans]